MPTLGSPKLNDRFDWLETQNRFYAELINRRGAVLTALKFYEEHGLQALADDWAGTVTNEEAAELSTIANALVEFVGVSDDVATSDLIATLKKVWKNPSLFFSQRLPAAVDWEIARHYRRGDEKPGTHSYDVLYGLHAAPPSQEPTEINIARAAKLASQNIRTKRGRPYHVGNQLLAERLGTMFRSSGHVIVRAREPQQRGTKIVWVEGGPFYDFLHLVLEPLQSFLSERGMMPANVNSIVRIITNEFSKKRKS